MTTALQDELLKRAWQAFEHAYAPYSGFQVGAAFAVRVGTGNTIQMFDGCNVENATYGATVCAERTAVQKAVSEGVLPDAKMLDLVVATKPGAPIFTPPCGMCRQVLQEFVDFPGTFKIHLSIEPGVIGQSFTLSELFPNPFDKNFL